MVRQNEEQAATARSKRQQQGASGNSKSLMGITHHSSCRDVEVDREETGRVNPQPLATCADSQASHVKQHALESLQIVQHGASQMWWVSLDVEKGGGGIGATGEQGCPLEERMAGEGRQTEGLQQGGT